MKRTAASVAIMSALFAAVWFNGERGISALARQSHGALCALRDDVQRRHDDSVAYLKEHPLGVVSPKTGAIIITAAQIRQSIANQESTLDALDASGLAC